MTELPPEVVAARGTVHDLRAARAEAVATLAAAGPGTAERRDALEQHRELGVRLNAAAAAALDVLAGDLTAEADVPLVLLPVRVETRYSLDGQTLRVRIYPDEVHTDALDEGLDDAERAAAEAYWRTRWANAAAGGPEDPQGTAWQALGAATGTTRAAWAAHRTTPENLDAFGRPDVEPAFPADVEPRRRRPAAAVGLPDRFHVLATHPDGSTSRRHGRTVPDELALSLPTADEVRPTGDDGLPLVDEDMRWIVDYDAARAVGMAVDLPLPAPFAPVERLLVLGVRSTLEPQDAAELLTSLLRAHRFADAAEVLAVGTPTNNTDADRTTWSRRAVAGPPPSTAPVAPPGSNAAALAGALGVDPAALAGLPGAQATDPDTVRALHLLLWESTWGELLGRVARPGAVGPGLRARLEDHWVSAVRARGPLPPLRVGRQPYGVLPVLQTAALRPDATAVERTLAPFLERLRAVWRLGLPSVPTMLDPADVDDALSEILGTAPVARGVALRTVATREASSTLTGEALDTDRNAEVQRRVSEVGWLLAGVEAGHRPSGEDLLGAADRTLALPFADDSDVELVRHLLDGTPAEAPRSILQVLLAHAVRQADAELARFGAREDLDRIGSLAVEQASIAGEAVGDPDLAARVGDAVVAVLQQERPDPATLEAASAALDTHGLALDRATLAARDPFPALTGARSAVAALTGDGASRRPLEVGDTALLLVGESVRLHRRRAAMTAALETLLATTTAERSLLLAEVLDACSHRLDAWLTSIATHRLAALRQARPTGVGLGAYAWVEGLRPAHPVVVEPPEPEMPGVFLDERDDGGFVQAPSLTHATTAAILRSGALSHVGESEEGVLAVDLEAGRVREALRVVDGVRAGQPLGALLGYRFERSLLASTGLARFVYALRPLAPLVDGRFTAPGAPQEVVAVTNVVDGVRLREISTESPDRVDDALTRGPKELGSPDGRYLLTWPAPSAEERAGVWAALRALDTLYDAVADLLLAESVHQLVQGNPERSAAALDALGGGEALPPEPDVVRTPRSGLSITHRVGVVLPVAVDAPPGWSATAPRAVAEPVLEAWVARLLGPPPVDAEAAGERTAGLCALDVLYDADGDTYASTSLARRLPGLDPDVWELARSLRALVTGARPIGLDWLGRAAPEGGPADDGGLTARARAALDALESAVQIVATTAPEHDLELALSVLEPFGVRAGPVLPTEAPARLALARGLLDEAVRRLHTAAAELDDGRTTDAFTTLFGAGFLALPLVTAFVPAAGGAPTAPQGVAGALRPGADVRPWLSRAASVRPGVARWLETALVREALGGAVRLQVGQSASAPVRWVGLPFDPDAAWPAEPVTSWVLECAAGAPVDLAAEAVAGFVVDEWSEAVPRHVVVEPADGPPERRLVHESGLAVNANGPDARPPQAILLALSADGEAWDVDRLAALLDDVRALSRERLVTLEKVPFAGRVLPALYFRDWSLQGEPVIDFGRLATQFRADAALTFLRSAQP